jgi:hypothetical protein
MTRHALIDGIKRTSNNLYGKAFSIDIIRHSFISDLVKQNPSVAEKITVAAELGQIYRPQMLDMYNRK